MRALGFNPMESEIKDLVSEYDEGKGMIDFPEFLNIISEKITEIDTEEELINAFQVFDKKKTGLISMREFRRVCTTLGEKLSNAEINELIRVMELDPDSQLEYKDFIKMIMAK